MHFKSIPLKFVPKENVKVKHLEKHREIDATYLISFGT